MYDALSFMAFSPEKSTVSAKGRAPRTGLLAPRFDWFVKEANVTTA
jgi:hypothetical protein